MKIFLLIVFLTSVYSDKKINSVMKIPSTLSKPCIVSNGAVPTTVPPFPSSTTLATTTTTTTTTPRPPAPLIDPRLGNLANGEQVNIGAAGDGNINFPRTKRSSRQKRQVTCGGRLQTSVVYPTLSGQARYGDYPWMAVILTNDNFYVGGGVLIDLAHIITTAHRITSYPNGSGLKIRLGEWDATGNYEQYPYRDSGLSRVWIHESYNPNTLQNDVALMRMSTPIPVGAPGVIPICMPAVSQNFDGQRCWVAGWGKNAFGVTGQYQAILKHVDVPILNAGSCETSLRATRLGTAYILDRAAFICAGGELNKDACTGDGGSGLVCETSSGRWTLAGLVAWGIGCASQGVPAAYVNIPNYVSWIQARQTSA